MRRVEIWKQNVGKRKSDTGTNPRSRQSDVKLLAGDRGGSTLRFPRPVADHDPNSDWDVTVVTSDAGNPPSELSTESMCLDWVNPVFISEDNIRAHCNHADWLSCGLVRDAQLLAGVWCPPSNLEEPKMGFESYRNSVNNSLENLRLAFECVCEAVQADVDFEL